MPIANAAARMTIGERLNLEEGFDSAIARRLRVVVGLVRYKISHLEKSLLAHPLHQHDLLDRVERTVPGSVFHDGFRRLPSDTRQALEFHD
jgi:hypothetical protein